MKKYAYSDELANVVHQFLTDNDWHYSFDSETGVFRFGVSVNCKIRKVRYLVRIKEDEIIVYGICPIGADPKDSAVMAQMAEFICRANYGLRNGNFEFDIQDGEIRYKSFIDCDSVLPSTEVIKNSIYCTAAMYDRYGDGITSIIFAGGSAKEEIDRCENDTRGTLHRLLSGAGDAAGGSDLADMLARLSERLGVTGGDEAPADDTDSAGDDAETPGDLFD